MTGGRVLAVFRPSRQLSLWIDRISLAASWPGLGKGGWMRRAVLVVAMAALGAAVFGSPRVLHAQEAASIVGVVQDSSGAVLPGVTVEAASDVLIEKTRSA